VDLHAVIQSRIRLKLAHLGVVVTPDVTKICEELTLGDTEQRTILSVYAQTAVTIQIFWPSVFHLEPTCPFSVQSQSVRFEHNVYQNRYKRFQGTFQPVSIIQIRASGVCASAARDFPASGLAKRFTISASR
jgi:hypothetical protein